jgi:ubiquinone/menaquinone biosynthesis C-methylase UbiE
VAEPEFVQVTRAFYDNVAASYATRFGGELAARPLDRALLAGFAELVRAAGPAPIADIGCGPGSVTAHLNDMGSTAFGIDLSPHMVAQARQGYPDLRFEVGSMLELDLPDCCLGGIVAWYSIIHIPDEQLPQAFGEFFRVLAPGGYLMLAFQTGTGVFDRAEMAGHAVSVDFRGRQPEQVADVLRRAGLDVRARVVREPDDDGEFPEQETQSFLLARKPSAPAQSSESPRTARAAAPSARR